MRHRTHGLLLNSVRRLYRIITVHCYQFEYVLHYEIEMMFARDAEKCKLGQFELLTGGVTG